MDTFKTTRFQAGVGFLCIAAAIAIMLTVVGSHTSAQVNSQDWFTGKTKIIPAGSLLSGRCNSATAKVSGAKPGMPVAVSASDGTAVGGLGISLSASVTAPNTVTVNVCAISALNVPAKAYNVRVFP